MGIFRQILTEGKDLASVVDGIKKAVMNFKDYGDQQEALFSKELSQVEDQAQKAMADIAKVLDKHKGVLEAMADSKWAGKINAKLAECGMSIMGLSEPLSTTLAEFHNKPEPSGRVDCKACNATGDAPDGGECDSCGGEGAVDRKPTAPGRKPAMADRDENKKPKK